MKIRKRDGSAERKVLTYMILSSAVLARISDSWTEEGLFQSKWANTIGKWCVEYYKDYGDPPKQEIESLFESWAEESEDETSVNIIEDFLSKVSEEYESENAELNVEYALDQADVLFNRVSLKRLSEKITGDVERGKLDDAKERVTKYTFVEVQASAGIDVFQDKETLKEAFAYETQALFTYPGDLGKFFGTALERDGFIAFLAAEKKGKTFWLVDLAWRAVLQRKKVAFFSVGDMSLHQIEKRFGLRAAGLPKRKGVLRYPKEFTKGDDGTLVCRYQEKHYEKELTWQAAWKALQRAQKTRIRSTSSYFKLSVHPNSSLTVKGMDSLLQRWEREEWVPDVVVLDYADVLLFNNGSDERAKTNNGWKELRALSQRWHVLLATATQADAMSYKAELLDMTNFSEDKRKLAHVTGMYGINQNKLEKEGGIYRLN